MLSRGELTAFSSSLKVIVSCLNEIQTHSVPNDEMVLDNSYKRIYDECAAMQRFIESAKT